MATATELTDYDNLKRGDVFRDERGTIKIMAVVDGYVVARRPGCFPFVEHWKDFVKGWQPVGGAT